MEGYRALVCEAVEGRARPRVEVAVWQGRGWVLGAEEF